MEISQIINDSLIKTNGTNKLIGTASVTLPELITKTESLSVMGTLGEQEAAIRGHMEAMNCTIKFNNISKNVKYITEDVDLNIRAAIQCQDTETNKIVYQTLEVNLKGARKSFKPGEIAKASKAETEIEIAVNYYEMKIDGEEILKVDQGNYIYSINGQSIVEEIKRAIGWGA